MRTQLSFLAKGDKVTLYISERVAFNKWYAKVRGTYQGAVAEDLDTVDQQFIHKVWIKDEKGRDIYIDVNDIAHVEQNNGVRTKSIS